MSHHQAAIGNLIERQRARESLIEAEIDRIQEIELDILKRRASHARTSQTFESEHSNPGSPERSSVGYTYATDAGTRARSGVYEMARNYGPDESDTDTAIFKNEATILEEEGEDDDEPVAVARKRSHAGFHALMGMLPSNMANMAASRSNPSEYQTVGGGGRFSRVVTSAKQKARKTSHFAEVHNANVDTLTRQSVGILKTPSEYSNRLKSVKYKSVKVKNTRRSTLGDFFKRDSEEEEMANNLRTLHEAESVIDLLKGQNIPLREKRIILQGERDVIAHVLALKKEYLETARRKLLPDTLFFSPR